MTGETITSAVDPSAVYGALVTAFERATGDLTDADQRSVLRDATVTLTGVRPNTDRPARVTVSDEDRDVLALSLWDDGIVRPESVAREAVDRILDDPFITSRLQAAPSDGVWTCGHCGRAGAAHGLPGNPSYDCVFEPIWKPITPSVSREQVAALDQAIYRALFGDGASFRSATAVPATRKAALAALGIEVTR